LRGKKVFLRLKNAKKSFVQQKQCVMKSRFFSLKINDVTPGTTGKKNVEPPEKYFFSLKINDVTTGTTGTTGFWLL